MHPPSTPHYQQPPLDLFGQVPITDDDIAAWVAAVSPRWLAPERAFRSYVLHYAVADKVRRAKIDGTFDAITDHPRHAWHARLALAAVL